MTDFCSQTKIFTPIMKLTIFILPVFLAGTIAASAQFKTVANSDTLYLDSPHFYVNGEKHRNGFFYHNLAETMKINPEANAVFRKSQRNYNYAFFTALAGAAVCMTGVRASDISTKTRNGLLLGSMPFTGVSLYCLIKSQKQRNQSVIIWNQRH